MTGAYHGSRHEKLLAIAHIEPLETKLDDISVAWAARILRTGDPHIRHCLDHLTSPHSWYDGRGAPFTRQRPHPIGAASYKTTIQPEGRSYGDRDDTTPTSPIDLSILEPKDERSKYQAYWAAGLSNLRDEG